MKNKITEILKTAVLNDTMLPEEALAINACILYVNSLDDSELEAFSRRYGTSVMNNVMELAAN
jgi:hypothetical protein